MEVLIVLCLFGYSSAVIYHMNDSQYELMPKMQRLYPYEKCLREPEALYCTVDFVLVSDEPSPLLQMIQEYSEHTSIHFNHTILTHGICVKETCGDLYTNTKGTIKDKLEACLNKTFWDEYRLKTKATDKIYCNNEEKKIDYKDMIVAILLFILLVLNVAGTIYDVAYTTDKPSEGTQFLVKFSIRRNFRRLISDPYVNSDTRLRQLKGINGVRTIIILLVILAHSLAVSALFADNTHDVENLYIVPLCQILINGTVVMQTFFIMSGLLMVFNSSLHVEKHGHSWKVLPKAILMRWLRLTPYNAVLLAFTATWMRHLGSGPLWGKLVDEEVADCRKDWWWFLIYMNNYNDTSNCMIQAWYLAADMQLYCLGVLLFVCCRSKTSRNIVLPLLFVLGSVIVALQTYFQDLNGVLLLSPETARNFFIVDDTFNHIYKRGHTNISGYIVGMALGYIVYYWKDFGIDIQKYKKYRFLYWCTLPLLLIIVYTGRVFYDDHPRMSLIFRTLYAAFMKPVFVIIMATLILGIILKFENYYRSVLEWDGWTVPSKVTYAVYLVHVPIIRYIAAVQRGGNTTSQIDILNAYFGTVVLSFVAAYPFWLMVEAPLTSVFKDLFTKQTKVEEKTKKKAEKLDIRL